MTLTCGGCNKEVKRGNKLLINCSKCRKTFHNTCVSYHSSTSLSPKFNDEWICPDCSAKSKRGGDNSNTPIKPVISRDETSNELHSPDGVCSQGSAHIDDIISSLKKELPKLIREQLVVVISPLETLVRDLQASVTFLSDKYDDFSAQMDKLVADSDRHDKIITQHTDELQKLNFKISTLEQQLRDCNIEIHGVGESKTENLYNIVQKIAD